MAGVYYFGPGQADERTKFWLENPPSWMAFDVETVSTTERLPLGIGFAPSPNEGFYISLYPEENMKALEAVFPLFRNVHCLKIGHNILFDLMVIPLIPILENLDRSNIWDTNVAARYLGYDLTALDVLALSVLNKQHDSMQTVWKQYSVKDNMALIKKAGMEPLARKCVEDCTLTYQLCSHFKPKIDKTYASQFLVEMSVIPILSDLSNRGIAIDQNDRDALEMLYEHEVNELHQHIQTFGIENPNSPQQVGYILATRGNFLKFTRKKKQLSTSVEELEFLADPLAALILDYRKKSKFLNTYLVPMRGKDRFYTEYYMDTGVGRLNSRNRNIQNIPAANKKEGQLGARFMFTPDYGYFTEGDYSQEHLYIIANRSQDPDLMKVYYSPDFEGKRDIHEYVAGELGITRKIAKTINYALAYGATAQTLKEQSKIQDLRQCSALLDKWFNRFRVAGNWLRAIQEEGIKSGWAVETIFGRRIKIQEEWKNGSLNIDGMKRKAVNYPILGSDGEVIKRAILLAHRRGLGLPYMCMTVHDSIMWDGDVEDKVRVLQPEIENIAGFRIPFEVKVTMRWE